MRTQARTFDSLIAEASFGSNLMGAGSGKPATVCSPDIETSRCNLGDMMVRFGLFGSKAPRERC